MQLSKIKFKRPGIKRIPHERLCNDSVHYDEMCNVSPIERDLGIHGGLNGGFLHWQSTVQSIKMHKRLEPLSNPSHLPVIYLN